jgi:hypothetical protein
VKLFSLIAGAVVVVGAVVLTLVLTMGGDDSGGGVDRSAGTPSTSSTPAGSDEAAATYDLSTPEAAAASFAAVARTGSGEELLDLACVGSLACVSEHVAQVDEAQLTAARAQISEGVYELAEHLGGAEFGTAVDGPAPGTKNVPYRTPAMTGDTFLTLTFVQSEGDWLYYVPATP